MLLALLAVALVAALLSCSAGGKAGEAAEVNGTRGAPAPTPPGELRLTETPEFVKLATVEAVAEAGVTAATGKVSFDEERVSRVAAPVSGRVLELLAHPGDRVKKGQGLLVIASPDAQSAVADHVAAVADEAVARRNLERQRRLYADQAVPYKDVQQAEGDATKAAAALTRAAARLEVLGIDPKAPTPAASRFVLRAPIEGIVVERPAFPGMEVRPDSGIPLVTVADLTRLWVLADVYERDLSRVAAGQRAAVRVVADPGRAFDGKVTHVGELVDPATRTVKVRIEVSNPRLELKPEMFARVTVQGAPPTSPALVVPSTAVLSDGDASAVVVAQAGGKFEKRTVELGPEQDGRVRVLAGLRPGERVVSEGALFLKAAIEDR
jgi:cobalt-zinc-cadmium efflux system membrane fusion protein